MKNYQKPQVQTCELYTTVILAGSSNGLKSNVGLQQQGTPINAWNGR